MLYPQNGDRIVTIDFCDVTSPYGGILAHGDSQPTHVTAKLIIKASVFIQCATVRDILFLINSSLKLLHTLNVFGNFIISNK